MPRTPRLGVLATHPVQYHAPLFRELAAETELKVFYAHRPTPAEQGTGFGVPFSWDVDLMSGYDHEFLQNVSRAPGVASFDGCDTPGVAARIRDGRFDAFLIMGWHARSYWQAMRAAWSSHVPLLVRGDSQLGADGAPLKRALKRVAYPLFIRRFGACLSVGERSAEYFRYYGARRIVHAPHYVDNDFFARRAAMRDDERRDLRRGWGADDESLLVLFAGKLQTKKRPLDLVAATAAAERGNLRLLVVGDGHLRKEVEEAAARLNVRAAFAGFLNQTEIPRAYAAADVLALPSDAGETWGLVVNEAMASGRPAVVSDAVGCAPDLIRPDVTGWRHPLGDVEALAAILRRLADEPPVARVAGEAARAHIASYSLEAATRGVLEAVRAVRAMREAA